METGLKLELQVISRIAWQGGLEIIPVLAFEGESAVQPGKQAGDVLVVQGANGRTHLYVSLGLPEKANAEMLRRAGGATARWLLGRKLASAAVEAQSLYALKIDGGLEAFCEGLLLGAFRFDRYKSEKDSETMTQVFLLGDADLPALEDALRRIAAIAAGANLARDVAHEPPNLVNPLSLAGRAQALAERSGLKCTVLGEAELKQMGAGAILAVGQGSQTPSQMIVLEYPGQPGQPAQAPVVVVGKAITFDTGGYSMKEPAGMVGMKYDKSGGANVLGIMQALDALKPAVPVVGIIAAAENMVSAQAYRPNDIITSLSGKTIEIISTDAEGRLVLADALTYAHTHFQPRAVIDMATLTGGIVVALGKVRAGIMSNNHALADALMAAGERTYERLWRMPLDEEYFELIKGDDSDLRNSNAERGAHPIVGGIFLKQFIPDEVPWAHLDIAGPATTEKDLPYCPKGATGFGVRLVLDYILNL